MTTIRIAHLADSHLDERNRLADNVGCLNAFLAGARERGADLIIHAGDFFERRSTPAERNVLADFLLAASEIAPVFGVRGNHDAPGDLEVFSMLDTAHPVTILDRPTVEPQGAVLIGPAPIAVLALPWFTKAHLCASLDASTPTTQTTELTIQAARTMLTALRAEAHRVRAEGGIPLLAAHVLVAGSEVSTGQTLIGTTVELSPSDLADVGCEYVALGHIHKPQSWLGGRVAYSGSTQRNNFGEPEAKGWNLVTLQDGKLASVEFVELPARRIVLLERDWSISVTSADSLKSEDVAGALVRFRYRIRPGDLHLVDEDYHRFIFVENGAHEVKLEAVLVHEARVRSTEIVSAQATWEKVQAYWTAKGISLSDAEKDRVRDKLARIEQPEGVEVGA
jgi:exonuclease SbcD